MSNVLDKCRISRKRRFLGSEVAVTYHSCESDHNAGALYHKMPQFSSFSFLAVSFGGYCVNGPDRNAHSILIQLRFRPTLSLVSDEKLLAKKEENDEWGNWALRQAQDLGVFS